MICPYCNKQMERGLLYNVNGEASYWLPDGESLPFFLTKGAVERKNGLVITKQGFWEAARKETFICRDCRKAVLDLE